MNDFEYSVIRLLAFRVDSSVNCTFMSSAPFSVGAALLFLICRDFLCILEIGPLRVSDVASIFPPSVFWSVGQSPAFDQVPGLPSYTSRSRGSPRLTRDLLSLPVTGLGPELRPVLHYGREGGQRVPGTDFPAPLGPGKSQSLLPVDVVWM